MKEKFVITFVALFICWTSSVFGAEWYVKGTMPTSGDGTEWEKAFKTIEEGINAAAHGDIVWVAPGVYTP